MKRLLGLLCLAFSACTHVTPADLAIRDVNVVDVTDGSVHPHQTVLVSGDRISVVGPADAIHASPGAEIVDGAGGYLIPGLWDTHVHSAASLKWHFPLFLAYGITSVRNMHTSAGNPLELVSSIKRRLATGELLGPRFLANGPVVDGDPPVWPGSVVVRNADEARAAVDRLVDGGADFIKVYDRLTPESYFAIMERAKERGIPVDGHLPFLIKAEEAAAAGQRTIEHTSGITSGCSAKMDTLRADYVRYLAKLPGMPPYPDALVGFFTLVREALDSRDPASCMKTVHAYLEHGVTVVPTLVANAASNPQAFVNDPVRMGLLPPAVREQWKEMAAGGSPLEAILGPVAGTLVENVRMLNDAGVVILAGTDVGNPFLVPGLSLHRELEQLRGAGLSPLQALQAATIRPARVFGMAGSLGTVEAGKLADLVLLDASPLESISNTQRIRSVVANGRLFRRADLDRLLAGVANLDLHEEQQD
ncbi:MAG TPA: amidohydrolase family protein [Candidatus Saccharimonadales bacterium]|nr:amidohydrolase family protein [Candidatus Saccharimonadales bacterium]